MVHKLIGPSCNLKLVIFKLISSTVVSVLLKLFMAPVQMPILRIFGQVTHSSLIKWPLQVLDICKKNYCDFVVHAKMQGDLKVWKHHSYSKSGFHTSCVMMQKQPLLKFVFDKADNVTVLFFLLGSVTIHVTARTYLRNGLWAHNYSLVKIILAVILILMIQSGHNFAHVATDVLS